MIFDKLAGACERFAPQLVGVLHAARIFKFEGVAHEIFNKEKLGEDERDFLHDQFFLPFPVTAIEDKAGVVILMDVEKDAVGMDKPRLFIMADLLNSSEGYVDALSPEQRQDMSTLECGSDPDVLSIVTGFIKAEGKPRENGKIPFSGMLTCAFIASKRKAYGIVQTDTEKLNILGAEKILNNVFCGAQELMYFNRPGRFVLEEAPAKKVMIRNLERVLRTPDRPIFTLLEPSQIRHKLRLPPLVPGGPKQPHERRRHTRTLTSERFTAMKGKTIIIPACWIGPDEAKSESGKRMYKVRLDL